MAKRNIQDVGLSSDTVIEVILTRGEEVLKKEMTVSEWKNMKKQPGYVYTAFQLGFSKFLIK